MSLAAVPLIVMTAGVQLAHEANDKVRTMSGPIIALGVSLLVLSIVILVIAYINSRLPKGD